MEKIKKEQLSFQVSMIIKMANTIDLKFISELTEIYKKDFANYEAIGILDGNPKYFITSEYKKALRNRIIALENFIKTLHETNNAIIEHSKYETK